MLRRAIVFSILSVAVPARADLVHETVSGRAVDRVRLDDAPVTWDSLSAPKAPRVYTLAFSVSGAVLVPHCNGREKILVDGVVKDSGSRGPVVLTLEPGSHEVRVEVKASVYEKRIACSEPPRSGAVVKTSDGLTRIRFASPAKDGGEAVVFVPGGHDALRPAAVLVGTHPWNGGPFTYAAYKELLDEAGKKDVVLLLPSGLGNSLYVAEAEDEVMRALDALGTELAVDRQRVSIWGASMGGAGATTVAFHRPDRFAFVASFFGDSRYDLTTYVKSILGGEAGARRVNALDVLENGRHLPVFLVHGEDDTTSPMKQSTMLEGAMRSAGFSVELLQVPKMGHEGPLVVKHVRTVVDRAETATAPRRPARVTFRSVRPADTQAYGVGVVRAGAADAFVDLERTEDGVRVHSAKGVTAVTLAPDALGATREEPVVFDHVSETVPVTWAR